MASGLLTTTLVDRAHRHRAPCEILDGAGLYFRKQSASCASWELRYTFLGRRRSLTIGHYPDMPLAQAREEARAKRVMLDKDIDPAEEKRRIVQEQRKRACFMEVAEAWYAAEIAPRVKHTRVARTALDKHLIPRLGNLPAGDIRAHDLIAVLDRIKGNAPTVANDVLRFAKRVMARAVRQQIISLNPFSDLSPRLDAGGTEKARRRWLSLNELRSLSASLHAAPAFGAMNLLTVKLLLALCVRKMELLAAQWAEFDLEGLDPEVGPLWHLPGERTKMREPLEVPLVPQVVEWLQALKLLSARGTYLFPQRRRDHRRKYPHISPSTLNVALRDVAHGLPAFTVHDLRRTARTQLAALKVRTEVAERCLGHKLPGIQGTYDIHDYFHERREALTAWTAVLVDAFSGQAKVVPIRPPGALPVSLFPKITSEVAPQGKFVDPLPASGECA